MKDAYLLNCSYTENNFDSEYKASAVHFQGRSWVLKASVVYVESLFALYWDHNARDLKKKCG